MKKEIKDIESYKLGYMNALDSKNKFRHVIMGYEINEIFKILAEHKDKTMTVEFNGTREEAIKKHATATHNPQMRYFDEQKYLSEVTIKGFEALGLIKFKEEKKVIEIDVIDKEKVIIKRCGVIVYKDT